MADSVKRPKTPAGTAINHDVYDEAVDADDEDFDQELDIGDEQHPSLDSNITLESVHTSLIRAAGAAGAVAGAGGLFSDDVTLESVQAGPYHYEDKPFGPPQEYRTISEMAIRPSDDSIVRESIFQGHTGIAPAGWRLKSEPGSEYGEDDDTDEGFYAKFCSVSPRPLIAFTIRMIFFFFRAFLFTAFFYMGRSFLFRG